jgi:catalase-peroxidase
LSNDFFVNLFDMSTKWSKSSMSDGLYEGRGRATGKVKWTATPVDLAFGSNSELRALAEVYAETDGRGTFVQDFVNTRRVRHAAVCFRWRLSLHLGTKVVLVP